LKSDGKLYKVKLSVDSVFDNDLAVFAFIQEKSKDWQVLEVLAWPLHHL
jgi:hypothetical protein